MILGDIIERNARLYPEHAALRFEGRTITHSEHAERAIRLANALIALEVRKGDRLAVLAQNRPEYIETYSASEIAGFITVGLNYRLAAPEQAQILADCAPRVVLFEAQYAARMVDLVPDLPAGCLLISYDAAVAGAHDYAALLEAASSKRPAQRPVESDTAFLIYTSGSTGRPKGVMHSHSSFFEMARAMAQISAVSQADRQLIVMPYYHIGAKVEQFGYTMYGATIVLHRAFDARAVLASMASEGVTAAHLAPTMIQMMLDCGEADRHDLSRLHTVCYASAPMSEVQLRRSIATFGPVFMQVYGMSEAALSTVLYKHQHVLEGTPAQVARLASAGQPVLEDEVRTVRADGSDCASGEVGEIWGRSKSLMQGYWGNPEGYTQVMTDGFMRTGDMGYFDDEGFLFVVDRKKDMIISGGENIYSREVEEALLKHPQVREAAVIGVPDARWGESVKAFVVLREAQSVTAADIIEHCRTQIASYKKPASVEFVEALPRLSSTNKVDKKALREPYWQGKDRQTV